MNKEKNNNWNGFQSIVKRGLKCVRLDDDKKKLITDKQERRNIRRWRKKLKTFSIINYYYFFSHFSCIGAYFFYIENLYIFFFLPQKWIFSCYSSSFVDEHEFKWEKKRKKWIKKKWRSWTNSSYLNLEIEVFHEFTKQKKKLWIELFISIKNQIPMT